MKYYFIKILKFFPKFELNDVFENLAKNYKQKFNIYILCQKQKSIW